MLHVLAEEGDRVKAFVLIQKLAGTDPVGESLRAIPGIVRVDDLTGPFDAIALAHAESTEDLFRGVVAAVRELPGVTQALAAPLVRSVTHGRNRDDVPGEAA